MAGQLADALVRRGATIQTNTRVDAIERHRTAGPDPGGWVLSLHGPGDHGTSEPLRVDGVVVAVPATEAAVLLAAVAPLAAGILSTVGAPPWP